jgi:hypothetical protein
MHWQSRPVSYTSIATNFNKPPYIRLNFPPKITFHFVLFINNISNLANLFLSKFLNPDTRIDTSGGQNALARCSADAIKALQSYPNRLFFRKVYASNACHCLSPLPLFMLGILANNPNHPSSPDNLAFSAYRLNRSSHFHFQSPFT